ncbi:MAG TPA: M48 family metallopeptidase [Patescibacteria group bacterium]|nr:M48 family metallopeptidase [Patescibacteria group bacterium]
MAHGSTRGSLTEGAWLTLRALAALLLAIGFYVAVLTLVGVLLFIAGTGLFYGKLLFLKVALFLLAAAGAILWAIWPHRDHFDPPWPTLDRKEAPRLFALIDEVAAATRQRLPRTVYLIPDANAWVMQRGGTLGVGGRRVMGLGLALMAVVTERELRAILAHEFGHFHRGDTRLGPLIYRTRAAMGRTIAVLEDHVVVLQWVFIAYGKLYLALTHRISRHQELLADALAASIAGRRAMSDALTKTLGAGVVSDTYWSGDVVPLLKRGFLPPLAEGFRQFLRTERVAEAMHAVETKARSDQSGGRYDTHPPLGERLKALERIPDVALAESGPALALLADPAARERDLVRAMLEPERASALQQVTWEETPSRVMMPWYAEVSQAYHPYFGGMVLADVPSRTRGLAITLGDRADKDEGVTSPEMIRLARGAWAVGAAISTALDRAGWSPVGGPGEMPRLVRAGVSVEPLTVVSGALGGQLDAEQWSQWCRAHGIADLPMDTSAAWTAPTPEDAGGAPRLAPLPQPPTVPEPTRQAYPGVQCWSCRAPLPITRRTRGQKIACPQCGIKQRLPGVAR